MGLDFSALKFQAWQVGPAWQGCGRWVTGLWPTYRLLETLLVRAVTEARDTESGSSPSPSRMARWSRSSISSTAGSSGEEVKGRWVEAGLGTVS